MKFCHQCGNRLSLGTEKYCPECGADLISSKSTDSVTDGGGTGPNSLSTSTNITETSGDVIGSTTSGTGNIIGKEVAYSVQGNVFHIHVNSISAQTLQELTKLASQSMQLETKQLHGELRWITPKFTNEKVSEAKTTKEQARQALKDIDQIGKEKGVQIEQIRVEELHVSRTELQLKDIISEGNEYYYKAKYLKAIECYDEAIKIDDDDADAWNNKGNALDNLGRYGEAIECYDEAIKIDKNYAMAWNNKGISLDNLGRYGEAIECYDEAIKIDKDDAEVWINRGTAFYWLGKYIEAIESYDEAIRIDKDDADAWYNKGLSLGELGRYNEAIVAYDKALKIDKNNAVAWNNKGHALYILGMYNQAITGYDEALKIDKNNAVAWNNKGHALEKLGKHTEARKCFDIAKQIA